MNADPRIARVERGIRVNSPTVLQLAAFVRADLHAWQEIAERHPLQLCGSCEDRQAADAALDRLDQLWGENGGTS